MYYTIGFMEAKTLIIELALISPNGGVIVNGGLTSHSKLVSSSLKVFFY